MYSEKYAERGQLSNHYFRYKVYLYIKYVFNVLIIQFAEMVKHDS